MNPSISRPSSSDDSGSRAQPLQPFEEVDMHEEREDHLWSPIRTEIPDAGLGFDLESLISSEPDKLIQTDKVQKRASNVMKLTQENEKLKAELKAMTDRLEAAEKRKQELEKERARRAERF